MPKIQSAAALAVAFAIGLAAIRSASAQDDPSFVNFETAPVHPLELVPSGGRLLLAHGPSATLEVFDISGAAPVALRSIPVGLDPVSVRARSATEAWVVNAISDSVSVVDLVGGFVRATLTVGDDPTDVVFAGQPQRAFVSCATRGELHVFDPADLTAAPIVISLPGNSPRSLAVSPHGNRVYAAFFASGNGTTAIRGGTGSTPLPPSFVDSPEGPYGGVNPPPNDVSGFVPPLTPGLPTPPKVSLIVRHQPDGSWTDDNGTSWTQWISGADAAKTGRVPGWKLRDTDVAIIDSNTLAVTTLDAVMTHDMALSVNPASGRLLVVGTEATNERRFEPVIDGTFVHVVGAFANADGTGITGFDLNPHLDYSVPTIPLDQRLLSIGDPRSVVWNAAGTRAYVAGMGSSNVVVLDDQGARVGLAGPIEVGQGPVGLAIDAVGRLYAWDRFEGALSVVDLATEQETLRLDLHDPTPAAVRNGREYLYDTHETSGLGQVSCASCHLDARTDDLAWDLGNPAGTMGDLSDQNLGAGVPDLAKDINPNPHPMKGPMLTQTLQDIIGMEPFHWRGDKDGIEEFNPAFTNLQGAESELDPDQMQDLKNFLATIHYPPNPYRELDNSLPTQLVLPGHFAAFGGPLPPGNAQAGLATFINPGLGGNGCIDCHTLPTGAGTGSWFNGTSFVPLPAGPLGEKHLLIIGQGATGTAANNTMKVPNFRDIYLRAGMQLDKAESPRGFGTINDGSEELDAEVSLLLVNPPAQKLANVLAFIFSISGSELPEASGAINYPTGGPLSKDAHAAVGHQATVELASSPAAALAQTLLGLAEAGKVGLVAKGPYGGELRGFALVGGGQFQSDRLAQVVSMTELVGATQPGAGITFTAVPKGSETRLGIDRDQDGFLDRDELDASSDPADPLSIPGTWVNLGGALAGSSGAPTLWGTGPMLAGATVTYEVAGAAASAPTTFVLGVSVLAAPFKGGTLVPAPALLLPGLTTDASGALSLGGVLPPGVPPGTLVVAQGWIVDGGGPHGLAATNGVSSQVP